MPDDDARLSEFVRDDGGDDAPEEQPNDPPEDAPDDLPEDPPDDPHDDGTDDPDPAVSTSDYRPDGAACDACGASVRRRWRDDGALVCADCKDW